MTGSGTIDSATQQITGIDVSSLPDGLLTFSVTLTDTSSNIGDPATATATLDRVAPTGYSVAADDSLIGATGATNTSFTFDGAEIGTTYDYTVSSDGGAGTVTGSATIDSATQQITGIDVSSLPDGELTFSVTLTDPAGNVGTPTTATATLDQTAPAGYSVTADDSLIGATEATSTSFTITGAEVGATYSYTITDSASGSVTDTGTISSAIENVTGIDVSLLADGTLTFSITLTDPAGNAGTPATATAVLDQTAPTGYSIAADDSLISATEATNTSFTITGAEVGATYTYTITDSGSGSVTDSGTINTETQQITGIDVSLLAEGTLTFSVTLTDPAGNAGTPVTATATLDKTAPAGYSITAIDSLITGTLSTSTGFTFAGAEVNAVFTYTISDSGTGTVTDTGTITSEDQPITGIDVSLLADGTLTFSVTLTDPAGNVGEVVTTTATLDKTLVGASSLIDTALQQTESWLP